MKLSYGLDSLLVLVVCVLAAYNNAECANDARSGTSDGSEEWGYVEVRPNAHMFWWLYHSPQRKGDSWPLILWLQGGPGASSVAIGNFEEVGPLDTQLKPRNTTWLQKADLLFVDSPVGTGFSYVESAALAAQTDAEVTQDLLSFLRVLFNINSTLLKNPLYIVGESYGGKHAIMTGLALSQEIAAGRLKVNLGGVALGDSWISPVDYVLSWGHLLKDVSRLEATDEDNANSIALRIQQQVEHGDYGDAIDSWVQLERFIGLASNDVMKQDDYKNQMKIGLASPTHNTIRLMVAIAMQNLQWIYHYSERDGCMDLCKKGRDFCCKHETRDFYNFLLDSSADPISSLTVTLQSRNRGTSRRYLQYLNLKRGSGKNRTHVDLDTLMNGVIRSKLKIIPSGIRWGSQSDLVFAALENDFMKSAVDEVDEFLSRGENVTIYNGQVDLICATVGTEAWVQKLRWKGLNGFNSTKRTPLYCNDSTTTGFVKSYNNLNFFWVLGAGHFVPVDQPCVAMQMLDTITNTHHSS